MARNSSTGAMASGMRRRSLLKSIGASGIALSGLGGAGSLMTQPAAAATGSIIDDFDDGDLSEYTVYRQGPASVVSSPTYSGAGALKIDGTSTDVVSMSGLPDYPEAGDTFSTRVRWTSNANGVQFAYGIQTYVEYSDQEYYFVNIRPDADQIVLKRYDLNGKHKLDKNFNVGLSADTWYELEVDWQTDGTHTITLFDESGSQVTQLSATDSTWTDGGVGFFGREANSGATVHFDEAVIGDPGAGGGVSGLGTIDNFDDSDLGEYTVYRQGPATITSTPTANGSGALKIDGTSTDVVSMSGLPAYPAAGDTFSVRVRWTAGANGLWTAYGMQTYVEYSDQEYYFVNIRPDADQIVLNRYDLNGKTELDKEFDIGLNSDEWYELKINWQADGTHHVTLYEADGTLLTHLTGNDATWDSGGIGFFGREATSGATVYFDEAQGSSPTIGAFEGGLDGWFTNGANSVTQISVGDEPAAITQGNTALDVAVDSDPEPMLGNTQRIRNADFENYPYLLADLIPVSVENTDSPVTFRFRYHHTASGGVEESDTVTVNQKHGGILAWDMSDLSAEKLAAADQLEIAWYPDDHPPSSGFDHNGRVFVDNIRLVDDPNEVTNATFFQKHCDLERAHGVRIKQEIQSQTEMTQDGVYKHDDGTDVSYHMEILANGDIEETVDGDTFCWKGVAQ